MIKKILIANRGEIAVRIIKTAKKLNILTVAVYSEADANALHVLEADEAFFIGRSPANESYLDIDNIMQAIEETGADAVHPGYGFLSENAIFAEGLANKNITFIGPNHTAIKDMGDKINSKKIAKKAGINTVPGYIGVIDDNKTAKEISNNIGYPVMFKASAGGGGRGMRIVNNDGEVDEAFLSAKKEALSSFGDDRLFIEKFIEKPRHIEIQILGDKYGNYICLGERECSIQRYNQKVIEESPSPFISSKTREAMYEQSILLAKAVDYYSAGTVEYIVDQHQNFYFLEVNTRLQVEHPVTEYVTSVDIVQLMIEIADNKKLPFTQNDIKLNGWSVECRICAEDPSRFFLPSSGRVSIYQEPSSHKNIRVDTGIYEGGEVSMFYDSMVAKLITYGINRHYAIKRMQKALDQFVIEGISHNINFLQSIMHNSKFLKGNIATNFIATEYPDGYQGALITSQSMLSILVTAVYIKIYEVKKLSKLEKDNDTIIKERDINTRWNVIMDDKNYPVNVLPLDHGYQITYNTQKLIVTSDWAKMSNIFIGIVNDSRVIVKVKRTTSGYNLTSLNYSANVKIVTPKVAELYKYMPKNSGKKVKDKMTAPISGKIISINVKEGDKILAGENLLTIEAMKMENALSSDDEVLIKKIYIKPGDNVQFGDNLIQFALVEKN